MNQNQVLREILMATRPVWDHNGTRPAVRENFCKMIDCRTAALGAEVYGSETEQRFFYHTCKSRACPSCGNRTSLIWQQELCACLPDVPYAGIGFTIPNVLWPIFQRNRHLLHDLPAIGACVIQQWAKAKYGVHVLVLVVQHTFGAHLNFNCHLHILVSAGGVKESDGRWIPLSFHKNALMRMWKYAVIAYLREALKAKVVAHDLALQEFADLLTSQYERDFWIVNISSLASKEHFLGYVARYIRRPPIAQRRFVEITDQLVLFWTKDKKEGLVITEYSVEDFVAKVADQVPDRYRHGVRYFGLLAARAKASTSAALFVLLRQQRRPRPRRLSWRASLWRCFRKDPLLDSRGQPMQWIRREKPKRQFVA